MRRIRTAIRNQAPNIDSVVIYNMHCIGGPALVAAGLYLFMPSAELPHSPSFREGEAPSIPRHVFPPSFVRSSGNIQQFVTVLNKMAIASSLFITAGGAARLFQSPETINAGGRGEIPFYHVPSRGVVPVGMFHAAAGSRHPGHVNDNP